MERQDDSDANQEVIYIKSDSEDSLDNDEDQDYDESNDFVDEQVFSESEDEEETQITEAQVTKKVGVKIFEELQNIVLCKLCNKTLPRCKTKSHLLKHTRKICRYCQKKCADLSTYKKHVEQHECRICHKKFWPSSVLTKHLLIHTDNVVFKCYTCDITFDTSTPWHTHRGHTIKSVPNKEFKCSCKQVFKCKDKYEKHVASCKYKAYFHCINCKRVFTSEDDFKEHEELTSYQCNDCTQMFSCYSLKKHQEAGCQTPKISIRYLSDSGVWVPISN